MKTMISALRRDRRGVTVVEFALVSPVMLAMICGTLEVGHMMFARAALEGAVVEAARDATATLESSEDARETVTRASIINAMSGFPTAPNRTVTITTKVFHDFSSATPENFTDANRNGVYDVGEDYIDRNRNGVWDPAVQIPGKLGGPGDVVSYTAVFPKRMLFGGLTSWIGIPNETTLTATTVVRNEAVVRKAA